MRPPKVTIPAGSKVAVVELEFDRTKPEPEHFRIVFPGGDVEVTRTSDCDAWVHVRVNTKEDADVLEGERRQGCIVGARLDIKGKHASESDLGDFENPDLYHLAVRVTTKGMP